MAEEDPTNPPGDDPDLDDNDPDDDDPPADPPADEDPATVTAERDKLRTTLEKVKAERLAARNELKALKAAANPPKDGDPPKADPDMRAKRMAGVAALTAEGLTKEAAKAAVRLLDLSDVELDEDGDADLEDQVESLKTKFPGMFAKADTRKTAPKVNTNPVTGKKATGGTVKRDATSTALLKQAGYIA